MEYFGPAIIVFVILIGVAVAAVAFEPANPLQNWFRLAEVYGTDDTPAEPQFSGQQVFFGGNRGALKPLHPNATFDATIDDFGLWLVLNNLQTPDAKPGIRIPGSHIRPAGKPGRQYRFELYAEPPVRIAVSGDFGAELHRKCTPAN